jgi:hypothetical protein
VSGQLHDPAGLPHGKELAVQIGVWVGPRTGLGLCDEEEIPASAGESNTSRPARSLVTTLAELSRLPEAFPFFPETNVRNYVSFSNKGNGFN